MIGPVNVNRNELQALLGSIQTSLGNVNFPPFRNASACGTAYEVYTLGLLLEEAVNAGADPPNFLCRNNIPATQPYTFRVGGSRLSAMDDYTYAELTFSRARKPKLPLEVHVGIYLCGPSCERVQSDVCVLLKEEAEYFRGRASRPRRNKSPYSWPDATKVLLTTECKYYRRDLSSRVIHEVIGRDRELPAMNHLVVVNTPSEAAGNRIVGCFGPDAWRSAAFPTNPIGERQLRDKLRDIFHTYITDLNHVLP
jgi:hypothetical protein